jgi:hypothetical protein
MAGRQSLRPVDAACRGGERTIVHIERERAGARATNPQKGTKITRAYSRCPTARQSERRWGGDRDRMLAAGVRVVPWTDWSEWAMLRAQLQCGDVAGASATLALYRLRRPATLPLAVQSTASLRALLVRRGGGGGGGGGGDDHARRLGLSMAIVRLVNGATDRIQPRADGAAARSVHSLAKALALPPVLVELRHQASHNALPRLDALEDAAHRALDWLEAEYWVPQAAAAGLPAPGAPAAPGALPASPEPPRKRRRRWQVSGGDWKNVAIGLMPGETSAPQLIGVDVAAAIGQRWENPGEGAESDTQPEPLPPPLPPSAPAGTTRELSDAERCAVERLMREFV